MIDLHPHILPGLHHGPSTIRESLDLARKPLAEGTAKNGATPHTRDDYPYPIRNIQRGVDHVNATLANEGLDLEVVGGAEVALSKIPELDDATLRTLCMGEGPYLLVETPHTYAPELLE